MAPVTSNFGRFSAENFLACVCNWLENVAYLLRLYYFLWPFTILFGSNYVELYIALDSDV